MFVLRSIFWLGTIVLLLPPSEDGREPAPRVSLLHTAYAARVLIEDVTGVCQRNPEACAASREAVVLLGRKLETGAGIVAAGVQAGRGQINGGDASGTVAAVEAGIDHGTLREEDLAPEWTFAANDPAR